MSIKRYHAQWSGGMELKPTGWYVKYDDVLPAIDALRTFVTRYLSHPIDGNLGVGLVNEDFFKARAAVETFLGDAASLEFAKLDVTRWDNWICDNPQYGNDAIYIDYINPLRAKVKELTPQ